MANTRRKNGWICDHTHYYTTADKKRSSIRFFKNFYFNMRNMQSKICRYKSSTFRIFVYLDTLVSQKKEKKIVTIGTVWKPTKSLRIFIRKTNKSLLPTPQKKFLKIRKPNSANDWRTNYERNKCSLYSNDCFSSRRYYHGRFPKTRHRARIQIRTTTVAHGQRQDPER